MDKDLLRIVIIAVGGVVILGMIIWGMLSSRSSRKKINFYDNHDPLEHIDPNLVVHTEDDDFDIVPLSTRDQSDAQVKTHLNPELAKEAQQSRFEINDFDEFDDFDDIDEPKSADQEPRAEQTEMPHLIQLSIVAKAEAGFSGIQLLEAFKNANLIYGSVKVFERLDELNQVDYAVASMSEPGTFPGDDWENYACPGIAFFLQPRELGDAAGVFDEMIETVGQLSALLNGDVLDQNQQHLTESTLQSLKASLH